MLLSAAALFPVSFEGGHPILVGAGDIAKCGPRLQNAEKTATLIDQVVAEASRGDPPSRVVVFTLGDTVYPHGKPREYAQCYDVTWGRHKERTRPAIGNHEYETDGGRPFFEYFGPRAGPPGEGYYSYDVGAWHVVALNSVCRSVGGCGPGSPQYEWLKRDLQDNAKRCTLAYLHHPLWSSGGHGRHEKVRPMYELLYQFGAELALSGHDHHYQRFAPQNPAGELEPQRGIRQFVVGTGGRGGRWYVRDKPRPTPNAEAATGAVIGVLKLVLKPDSYQWEFLSADGSFEDAGEASCHSP